eukprot:11164723-Alexandrium_andersonii.AAC.1
MAAARSFAPSRSFSNLRARSGQVPSESRTRPSPLVRPRRSGESRPRLAPCPPRGSGGSGRVGDAVSYTHLTLPTICSV